MEQGRETKSVKGRWDGEDNCRAIYRVGEIIMRTEIVSGRICEAIVYREYKECVVSLHA